MKNLFYACIAFVTISFTSCSSDDLENETMSDDAILGTWEYAEYFLADVDLVPTHLCLKNSTLTFTEDKKLNSIYSVLTEDEANCETVSVTTDWNKKSDNTYILSSFEGIKNFEITLDATKKEISIEYIDPSDSLEDKIMITLKKR